MEKVAMYLRLSLEDKNAWSKEILKKVLRASTDVVITIITATVEVQKKY